jgi:hypothetical protein
LALRDIADETREEPPLADPGFAHRKLERKRRAVATLTDNDPPDSDDALLTGRTIARKIRIVLLPIRGRHQDVDVPSDDFLLGVAEKAHCSGAE